LILLPLKFIDIVEIVWHILQNIDRQEKAVAGVKANGVRIRHIVIKASCQKATEKQSG